MATDSKFRENPVRVNIILLTCIKTIFNLRRSFGMVSNRVKIYLPKRLISVLPRLRFSSYRVEVEFLEFYRAKSLKSEYRIGLLRICLLKIYLFALSFQSWNCKLVNFHSWTHCTLSFGITENHAAMNSISGVQLLNHLVYIICIHLMNVKQVKICALSWICIRSSLL